MFTAVATHLVSRTRRSDAQPASGSFTVPGCPRSQAISRVAFQPITGLDECSKASIDGLQFVRAPSRVNPQQRVAPLLHVCSEHARFLYVRAIRSQQRFLSGLLILIPPSCEALAKAVLSPRHAKLAVRPRSSSARKRPRKGNTSSSPPSGSAYRRLQNDREPGRLVRVEAFV